MSHPIPFSHLPLTSVFEFDHTDVEFHRSMVHGPWVKTGARTYRHLDKLHLKGLHCSSNIKVWLGTATEPPTCHGSR
jgi:hypothetical protein